ncbi:MAG: DUF2306 domain-containing protein [Gemmatimonadaceae bacterium]|nr:DUF2306 domain-containing protein [Gemmatimonadaceae bacterium]MCW5826851.1 DUF2306 domain-containing protein [Gemmatimonadaceae bacterium]
MTIVGTIHFVAAVAAIVLGAIVLRQGPKGGPRHRRIGWTYLLAMLTVNATAFTLYGLFGGFGPFHVAAVVSLAGIVAGMLAARRARRARLANQRFLRAHRVEVHFWWMTFSYVGLVAALASEAITRLPATRAIGGGAGAIFAAAVGGVTALVFAVGSYLIVTRRARTLEPFRAHGAP